MAFAILLWLVVGIGNEVRKSYVRAQVIPLHMTWSNVTHVANISVSEATPFLDPEDDVLQSVSGAFIR